MMAIKPKKGAVKRSSFYRKESGLLPKWLKVLCVFFIGVALLLGLMMWQPWQPTNRDEQDIALERVHLNDEPIDLYDFYDELPKQDSVLVTEQFGVESETPTLGAAEPKPIINIHEQPSVFILQIGSFLESEEADQLVSKVVASGVKARVNMKRSAKGYLWYRVVAGPYQRKIEAELAQQRLQQAAIDAIVVQQN